MRKFILYIAFSLDEVYECAYSILKYLEVYNLKPPADHTLIIYAPYPDMLEAYGSFFNQFELRTIPANSSKESIISQVKQETGERLLYLDTKTYPVKNIDRFFSADSKIADDSIACYNSLKEFKVLLKDFFGRYQEESIPNQIKLLHNVDAKKIERQKQEFERLPLASKWVRKMMGKGWDISNYLIRV